MKIFKNTLVLLFLVYTSISKGEATRSARTSPFRVVSLQDTIHRIDTYLDLEKVYQKKAYSIALEKGYVLLNKYKQNKNEEAAAITNYILGNILYETNSYENALKYFKESLLFFDIKRTENADINLPVADSVLIRNEIYMSKNLQKIGSTYHLLKRNENEDSKIYLDSTNYYYNIIENLYSSNKEVLRIKAIFFNNIAEIHLSERKYNEAENSINKAIDIYKKIKDKTGEAGSLGNLASIYVINHDFETAKRIYLEALDLIKYSNTDGATRSKETLSENLAWSMYNLRDYKAYEYQLNSYVIKDSLRSKELREMIETITATMNFNAGKELGKKLEEVKRLQQEAKYHGQIQFALLIIAFFTLLAGYFKVQEVKALRLQMTSEIAEKRLEKNYQLKILNATVDAREKERKKIAENLHNSVSAFLSSVSLHLEATQKNHKDIIPFEIEKSQKIIKEVTNEIRALSHTLYSSSLQQFGLITAIEENANLYSNFQLKIKTEISGTTKRYAKDFELKIYNIIQELLNNILKHSKAKKALIAIGENERVLSLVVSDDGKGFDKEKIKYNGGVGINQVAARVFALSGEFDIQSAKGRGTSIYIKIPVDTHHQLVTREPQAQ